MKKIYLFASMVVGLTLSAQQNKIASAYSESIAKPHNISASITTATTTALIPAAFSNTTCGLYSGAPTTSVTGVGGYIAGNNRFGDKEKAMRYSLAANTLGLPATVASVYAFIGTIDAGGSGNGTLAVKIYADNAGSPGALLGTSDTRTISTLTAGTFTSNGFTFSTPVALTTDAFFVSVDFSAAGDDTLSLAQTFDCVSTNTTSAWEKDGTNAWFTIKDDWDETSDLGIFPVVSAEYALGVKAISSDLTLLSAFPNPAVNEVSINFGLNKSSKVEIEVYDVTGKLVNTVKLDQLEAGNHITKMDVSSLNAGVYMYSVKSNNAKLFSKFTLVK